MNKFVPLVFVASVMVVLMYAFSGAGFVTVETPDYGATTVSESLSGVTENITDIMLGIIPLVILVGVMTGIVGWAGGFGDMFKKS